MKRKLVLLLNLVLAIFLFACGQSESNGQDASGSGVETVEVAVGNAYFPFTYLNDDGELTGYDVAVLKEIDERLEQYEFNFTAYEFKTILPTLDSGQARIASHQFTRNPEREENYLFTDENFTEFNHYIVTKKDSSFSPESLDDLAGHSVFVAAGTDYSSLIEKYNDSHEEQIDATFGEMNVDVIVQEVLSGNAEATLYSEIDVEEVNNSYDDAFKASSQPVHVSETFFVLQKDDQELKEEIDRVLAELKEEGRIDDLKEEYIYSAIK